MAPAISTEARADTPRRVMACPACAGTVSVQIGGPARAFASLIGGKTFRHPTYTIRRCATCDLYFKSHTLALEHLDDLYARLDYETFDRDDNFPTDACLLRVLQRLPNGARVLDYGCSTGRILRRLTGRLSCFGVEINETAASIARERGIRIMSEQRLRTTKSFRFDAVLLTDVYEHLPRPLALLEMLARVVKPGGCLAIVTGNADAICTRDSIGEFWYFRWPGHFHMLSERHLDWLAHRLELHLDQLHHCSHYTTSKSDRLRQYAQSLAYHQFRESRRGLRAACLRIVPFLRRAERWPNAPTLNYTADHVVAVLRKMSNQAMPPATGVAGS